MSSLSIHDGDQGRGHPAVPPAQGQPGPGRILTVAFATGQAAVAASSRSLALQLLSRFMPDETCFPALEPGMTRGKSGKPGSRPGEAWRSVQGVLVPQFPGDLIEGVSPFLQLPDFAGEHPDCLPRGVVLPLDGRQSAELAFDLPDLPGRVPCHRPPRVLTIRSPVDRMIADCQSRVMSIQSPTFTGWGLSYTCSASPDQTTPSVRRFASHLHLNPGKGSPPLHPGPLGVSLLAAPCGCPPFTSSRAA